MNIQLSLKQIWTSIVLLAVILPISIVMLWYGLTLYNHQLKSALTIEQLANERVKNEIEAEIKRYQTLLKNKSDPLSYLISHSDNSKNIKSINLLLSRIVEREKAVHGVMLLSSQGGLIAAIDHGIDFNGERELSKVEKNKLLQHWRFSELTEQAEFIIPSLGRNYISALKQHEGEKTFMMAAPVSNPVVGVLIIELDAENFVLLDKRAGYAINKKNTQNYILDRRGALITKINNSKYKPGELMTHLEIARSALFGGEWPTDKAYVGVSGQDVYGTMTLIPHLNWTLISEVVVSRIIAPIKRSLLEVFVPTLLAMIIFIMFVLRLARKTLQPIQHACEVLDHVAMGDYNVTLSSTGIKELDDMSSSIIRMTKARQNADRALQESEQDLIVTLNSIGDAVIACDASGFVTRMNPVAEQLTGWTIKNAWGRPIKSIFEIVNATTRDSIANPVDKVLSTGETVYLSNHTTLISRDGSEYQIADSAAPIRSENNKILGMVLVFNDVTEQYKLREQAKLVQQALQNKEKEQREIIDSMVDAVISIDEDGRILSFNKAAEKLFGYDFIDIKEQNVSVLMPEPYSIEHNNYVKHYIETEEAKVIGLGRDVTGMHKDKKIFPIKIFVAELPKGEDGKRRFIASIVDLTHLKQQEEQLRRSQKMDSLGKLTGGVAHDYNNMLGVVLGYAELLEGSLKDQPKLANYVNRIIQAAERSSKLTEKLLSFSKQKNTDAQSVDINSLLYDLQNMLEKTLTVRIKLEYKLDENLWPVWLSIADIEDVILNMAINASHAIDGNGVLTVQTTNEKINNIDANLLGLNNAGDYVKLSLSDTGCGMDEITLERIFDPFYSTKGEKGTGLGLSQVYGFIGRSSGTIKVYSELGEGTQFIMYLPRHMQESDRHSLIEESVIKTAAGHEKVLIVDDEVSLLELSREILRLHNYKILTAENAKQALNILKTQHVDLLLSDVVMPEMDGFQLAVMVQEKYPNVKIQLVSGFTDDRHLEFAGTRLQKNLLQKPFSSNELLSRIRNLLDEPPLI